YGGSEFGLDDHAGGDVSHGLGRIRNARRRSLRPVCGSGTAVAHGDKVVVPFLFHATSSLGTRRPHGPHLQALVPCTWYSRQRRSLPALRKSIPSGGKCALVWL